MLPKIPASLGAAAGPRLPSGSEPLAAGIWGCRGGGLLGVTHPGHPIEGDGGITSPSALGWFGVLCFFFFPDVASPAGACSADADTKPEETRPSQVSKNPFSLPSLP